MSGEASDTKRATWAAVIVATAVVAQIVASHALRDGFFLTEFPATALPTMVIASTILSAALLLTMARLLRNVPPARSVPFLFAGSAVLFVLEWALAGWRPHIAAVSLFLHVFTVGALVASGFWSVINERFDPHTARRVMGRIGGGASLGGVIGGIAAFWGASFTDIPTMILMLGLLNGVCAVGVLQIGTGTHGRRQATDSARSAFRIVRETPYLQHLGLLVALGAFCQTTYDYVLKSRAAEHFLSGADLVSFFALFYTIVNGLTFLVQNGLARSVLEKLGISAAVGSMPGSGALLGVFALLFPGLPTAIAMRGGIGVTENSLFRSGYELLYTPILPEKKRPTKSLIDVGSDDLGTALGAGFTFLVLALVPGQVNGLLVLAGIAASVGGLAVTRHLHRGYVWSLAESLRAGRLDLGAVDVVDATTQQMVSETLAAMAPPAPLQEAGRSSDAALKYGIDREALLERLRDRNADTSRAAPGLQQAHAPYRQPSLVGVTPADLDTTTRAIAHLRSGDSERARSVLLDPAPLPAELVVHVVPLLADEEVAELASESLRRVAAANTGTLLDAVRQSRAGLPVRRRVCAILGRLPTQRCARGLVDLLDDQDFELRLRAATSLLQIHRQNRDLVIPPERIFAAAASEAEACRRRWVSRSTLDPRISRTPPLESADGERAVEGMSYVWTLLPTVLDPEPLSLAIRALAEQSGAHRGTGLEYLDNVLPPRLLAALRPLIEDDHLVAESIRAPSAILERLVAHRRDETLDLDGLRRHIDAIRARRHSPTLRPA